MIKLIILFRKPADVDAFEDHFSKQHVPLIARMPNVVRSSVSRALGAPRGEPPFHLIHDVYFADLPGLNYALNSPEGRAAGADLMAFARDIVTLMFAEVWGEGEAMKREAGNGEPEIAAPSDADVQTDEAPVGVGTPEQVREEMTAAQDVPTDESALPIAPSPDESAA
jgi:uncharacterized protein (TIGR02118 family)